MIVAGAVYQSVSGTWRRSAVDMAFSALKVAGLVVGLMLAFEFVPGGCSR